MAKTGPRPMPTALKLLRGNPGKRPLPENEPQPQVSRPTCPSHLSSPARTEWRRIVPELECLGILTQIDRAALAGYCQAYGRWVEAEKALSELKRMGPKQMNMLYKTSNGGLVVNPLLRIASNAMDQMRAFLVEFGMTPSSRVRTVARGDVEDPLDAILNTKARN